MSRKIPADVIPELVDHLMSDREYPIVLDISFSSVSLAFHKLHRDGVPLTGYVTTSILTAALEAFNAREK